MSFRNFKIFFFDPWGVGFLPIFSYFTCITELPDQFLIIKWWLAEKNAHLMSIMLGSKKYHINYPWGWIYLWFFHVIVVWAMICAKYFSFFFIMHGHENVATYYTIRMKLVDRADIPWVHSKIPWGPIDKCVVYTWLSDTYTCFDEKLLLVNETTAP